MITIRKWIDMSEEDKQKTIKVARVQNAMSLQFIENYRFKQPFKCRACGKRFRSKIKRCPRCGSVDIKKGIQW